MLHLSSQPRHRRTRVVSSLMLGFAGLAVSVGVMVGMNAVSAQPASAETKCGTVDTSIISGDICKTASTDEANKDSSKNPIVAIITFVLQILTGAVGVAAVGAIIYGAILYSSAGGNSGQVEKAKTTISNTVIGIVVYAGMILILNFIIPGGVFGQEATTGSGTSASPGGSDGDDPLQTSNKLQFSIVSMPDTQFEINREAKYGDTKVLNNMKWVAENKDKQNVQVVVGPGDLTNAGNPSDSKVKDMFKAISKDYAVLDAARVPYSITSGNHDTDGTCTDPGTSYGSRKCPSMSKSQYTKNLHKTTMFDKTFTTNRAGLKGLTLYEPGRVVNSYRVFRVRDANWLILTMEFYPRAEVFKWAKDVVATHPTYNVVVVTHGYMGSGTNVTGAGIGNYCADGGDCTKPTTIRSDMLLRYPNVKMLFSGHVATTSTRIDTSSSGNKVVQFKTTVHACAGDIKCTNPMRVVTIDLENNTLKSNFCLTVKPTSMSDCESKTIEGMKYVRSGSSGAQATTTTALASVGNFRDAATLNSTILKPGLLYRSAKLQDATSADRTKLAAMLKNGTIIDLRTESVRKKSPDKTISGVENINYPIEGVSDPEGYVRAYVKSDSGRKSLGSALKTMANTSGATLIHCTAGKDRTGWTIALAMYIVGDGKYSMSKLDAMVMDEYLESKKSGSSFNVEKSWLNAAITAARDKYGSIMGYVRNGLGVDEATITKLKNKLGV